MLRLYHYERPIPLAATSLAYSGPGNPPDPGAALRTPGGVDSITGILATGMTGLFGFGWRKRRKQELAG